MSVLETFIFSFETDGEELISGLDDAEKSAKKTSKAIADTDDQTKDLGASFSSMAKSAGAALIALVSVKALISGVVDTASSNDALGRFSARLGETVEKVDLWSNAAVLAGGSTDGFQQSLVSLNEKLVDTAVKGTSELLPFFNRMGIAITDANGRARSTLDILPELSDAFKSLSAGEAAGIGQKLGLDAGTIQLLQSGNKSIQETIAELERVGGVTKEQTENSAKFNDALFLMKRSFQTAFRVVANEVMPILTSFFEITKEVFIFLGDHKSFAVSVFSAIAVAAGVALIPMAKLSLSVIAAFLPFIAIGAAVAAFGVILAAVTDDIYNFLRGNDSVIGELSKKWPIVGDVIKGLKDAFELYFTIMGGIIGKFADYLESPKQILQDIIDLFNYITDTSFSDIAEDLILGLNNLPLVGGFLETNGSTAQLLSSANQEIQAADAAPINSQTTNTIQSQSTRQGDKSFVVNGGINVSTDNSAVSGESASRETAKAMSDELNRMVDSFDDGVEA